MDLKLSCKRCSRVPYLDILRIGSVFAVIVLHVSAQNWYHQDVFSVEWLFFNFWNSIVRWCVPVFVMISGALFLDPKRNVTYAALYKKNIFRMTVAFIFWSAVYVAYTFIKNPDSYSKSQMIVDFIQGYYHMWFIFMIIGLYIMVPFLRKITEDDRLLKYFIIVAFIFVFLLPTIRDIAHVISPFLNSNRFDMIVNALFKAYDNMNVSMVGQYTAYFVLGHYLHERDLPLKTRKILYMLSFFGFAFTILFSVYIAWAKSASYGFYGNMTLNVLLESVGIFVLIKYFVKLHIHDRSNSFVLFLSNRSFGIYLVHVLIIEILQYSFGFTTLSICAYISVPVISLFVFLLSLLSSYIIGKIPVLGRYIS